MGPAEEAVNGFLHTEAAKSSYDPKKGASLETHVNNYMKKTNRDLHNSFSTLKSSEGLGLSLHKLNRTKEEYYMTHGRYPDPIELSKSSGVPVKLVKKHMSTFKVKTVGVDDFTLGTSYADIKNLLPDLSKKDRLIADTMTSGVTTPEALKATGLSQGSYYRASNKLRGRMRSAYLRSNTLER